MNESMNDQLNAPMPPTPSGMAGWFSVWMSAVTKPNEQTYAEIANSPDVKATTAYLWVFIGGGVSYFLASLVPNVAFRQLLQQYGGGQFQLGGGGIGARLITLICGAPIGAVILTVVFAVVVAIVQFLAKSFGGRGTFDQLAYTFAAIYTPFALVSGVLSLLGAIPYIGYCFSFISLLALLYMVVLQVMAVKVVNQFGWGQAAGSYFLPVLVLFCCLGVAAIGIGTAVAKAIGTTFNQFSP